MPRRDPQTGKFVTGSTQGEYEVVTWNVPIAVEAADLDGTTDEHYGEQAFFEGVQLYDVDQFIDRHEVGDLIYASHRCTIQPTGTQTADSAAFIQADISGSPSRAALGGSFADMADTSGDFVPKAFASSTDSVDLIGRPLFAMAQGPFTDGTAGLGGGGAPGEDSHEPLLVDFRMDRRDEVYLNGSMGAQNISDGPVTARVLGQHVYEVTED